jgi:hypothetical protein
LPSQGGAGAGFDLSASTQIIPIIDVTPSAEGSNLRQDLQTAVSLSTVNTETSNATATIINNTGFYYVTYNICNRSGAAQDATLLINDGSTDTIIKLIRFPSTSQTIFDQFVLFLSAGDSFKVTSTGANFFINTQTRQIATINAELVNPLSF